MNRKFRKKSECYDKKIDQLLSQFRYIRDFLKYLREFLTIFDILAILRAFWTHFEFGLISNVFETLYQLFEPIFRFFDHF
jgi:uncharacterized protein YggT (Ycf19 family)